MRVKLQRLRHFMKNDEYRIVKKKFKKKQVLMDGGFRGSGIRETGTILVGLDCFFGHVRRKRFELKSTLSRGSHGKRRRSIYGDTCLKKYA